MECTRKNCRIFLLFLHVNTSIWLLTAHQIVKDVLCSYVLHNSKETFFFSRQPILAADCKQFRELGLLQIKDKWIGIQILEYWGKGGEEGAYNL